VNPQGSFKKGNQYGCLSVGCHPSRKGEENPNHRHGMCGTPEYAAWANAIQRCQNPKNTRYADWGGRGIEFRFKSFQEFYAEVGPIPSPQHQLDRKDNDGHYEVGNVRWVPKSVQQKNKRWFGGPKFRDTLGRYSSTEGALL
jgi:hypothetical protein